MLKIHCASVFQAGSNAHFPKIREIYILSRTKACRQQAGNTYMRGGRDCRDAERQKGSEHLERGQMCAISSPHLQQLDWPGAQPGTNSNWTDVSACLLLDIS